MNFKSTSPEDDKIINYTEIRLSIEFHLLFILKAVINLILQKHYLNI